MLRLFRLTDGAASRGPLSALPVGVHVTANRVFRIEDIKLGASSV
jgi:hypothetical protein